LIERSFNGDPVARNASQNERMRDERRQAILSCAVRLFATRGLAATKVADIAAEVGMAQGLLYHYFRSKEEMFVEIVRFAFERMNGAARNLERLPLTPRQKIERTVTTLMRTLDEHEDFAWISVLVSTASISDAIPAEAKAIISRERDVPYRIVARLARAGQKDGSFLAGRPDDMALVFWTTVKGLALHRLALGSDYRSPDPRILTRIFFSETLS
jgi:AcrR family transcriptional regulator